MTNAVASSTRKQFRADQEMMRPSISVTLVLAGRGPGFGGALGSDGRVRFPDRFRRGSRLDADDVVLTACLCDELEAYALARFQCPQQSRILDVEIHGHARPLEAGDRAMGEAY